MFTHHNNLISSESKFKCETTICKIQLNWNEYEQWLICLKYNLTEI